MSKFRMTMKKQTNKQGRIHDHKMRLAGAACRFGSDNHRTFLLKLPQLRESWTTLLSSLTKLASFQPITTTKKLSLDTTTYNDDNTTSGKTRLQLMTSTVLIPGET